MPIRGLRLAVPRRYFCEVLDDDVRGRFEEALDRLRAAGARIHDVDIHHAQDIATIYLHIVLGDAAAYHATTLETMPDRYTPPVRIRLEMSRYVLAEDYVRALTGRDVLKREVDSALAEHDALILPTLPIPAPPIGASSVQVGATTEAVRTVMLRLTQPFNVTGHPAVSMPSGSTASGLPCGVQLVGARMQTDALLRVALACESQITPGPLPLSGNVGG
jgi:aspartyl-tRNA(Asn)/glutamyl-tRNA(Gln) amidotransferase subunit A